MGVNEQRSFPQTCHQAAHFYAHRGIPVFPVCGKVPFSRTRGFHDATTDPDCIAWWWSRWPDANVAVPTGQASGWIALDIDGRHAGFASLDHLKAMLEHRLHDFHGDDQPAWPPTLTARTGSGIHLIFRPPASELRNTVAFAGLPGIDLRGEGGYIVVAPSLHPNGRRYTWISLSSPAPFPPLLLDLLHQQQRLRHLHESMRKPATKPSSRQDQPEYWLSKALERACIGTRHSYALWLSCRLVEQVGLNQVHAETYIRQYVQAVPGDDYPLSDALKCLQWATQHVSPRI